MRRRICGKSLGNHVSGTRAPQGISSVTFRTGVWTTDDGIVLDNASSEAISPRVAVIPGGAPDEPGARLHCDDSRDLSDIVIYPVTASQRQRIEGLRLVRFTSTDDSSRSVAGLPQSVLHPWHESAFAGWIDGRISGSGRRPITAPSPPHAAPAPRRKITRDPNPSFSPFTGRSRLPGARHTDPGSMTWCI
ncbi:MAG: hypothetical protein M3Y22_05655 [Pseudomonadota bacterium]|jgi:hypothetical protein|nr:hypothetical protein [Pseudomonadota bacterium]